MKLGILSDLISVSTHRNIIVWLETGMCIIQKGKRLTLERKLEWTLEIMWPTWFDNVCKR